jgi:hypothetical protein
VTERPRKRENHETGSLIFNVVFFQQLFSFFSFKIHEAKIKRDVSASLMTTLP